MKHPAIMIILLASVSFLPWRFAAGQPAAAVTTTGATTGQANPFVLFTRPWRNDPVWDDGQAEVAIYDATRIIYGQSRRYTARLYTNKELASRDTKTKSDTGRGRPVFKHHLREDIDSENYAYHYSTMCYVGTADLKSLKIDIGSQEDCGTTFKQFINHAGTLKWHQFSYFPREGHSSGTYPPPANLAYQDALSLILRGYPFDKPIDPLHLALVPDQTSNRLTATEPIIVTVSYHGRNTLELPIGHVEAHHVQVHGQNQEDSTTLKHNYWFAVDGNVPWLHVMVRYAGPGELTLKLRQHKRWKYWKH